MARISANSSAQPLPTLQKVEGRYRNPATMSRMGFFKSLSVFWNMAFNKPAITRPAGEIPVQPLSRQQLLAAPDYSVYRLGHSTVLLDRKSVV